MSDLLEFLTPTNLRGLAGAGAFERGAGYAATRRVTSLKATDRDVHASVRGTSTYRVRLWVAEDELGFSCTCPVGEELEFCKHGVAVGLVLWERDTGEQPDGDGNAPEEELRGYLEGLPKQTLASLLMDQAAEDDTLRARLHAMAGKGRVSSSQLRSAIDAGLPVRGSSHTRRSTRIRAPRTRSSMRSRSGCGRVMPPT